MFGAWSEQEIELLSILCVHALLEGPAGSVLEIIMCCLHLCVLYVYNVYNPRVFALRRRLLVFVLLRSYGMLRGVEKDRFSRVLGWLVGCSHCVEILYLRDGRWRGAADCGPMVPGIFA